MEHEIWKDVVGFEGLYMVSNLGRVKGLERDVVSPTGFRRVKERMMQQHLAVAGGEVPGRYPHLFVSLSKGNKARPRFVHRLVLEAFAGPRPDGYVCCHNDGNGYNNRLDNLRWGTPKENTADSIKHGTFKPWNNKYKHQDNHNARFKNEDVVMIRKLAESGVPRKRIEEMYGAKKGSLSRILTGKGWVFE